MSRRQAFDFLIGLLSVDGSPELQDRLQRMLNSASLSWPDVVTIANEQWVSAAVWPALRRKSLRLAQKEAEDYFEGMTTLNRRRNAKLRAQAIELARLFNNLGVIPVFLKGAANLLSDLYPDPAIRIMVDMDVLVPPSRLAACVRAMREIGYLELEDIDLPAHHHYSSLAQPGGGAVELHIDPLDFQFQHLLSYADVTDAAVMMTIDDARLAVPAAWCRLAHCVAHKQFADHALVYGHLPLRDLLDSALLSRSEKIDFEAIRSRFSSRGARTALAFHLAATQRLLGGNIPEQGLPPWLEWTLFQRAYLQVVHPSLAAGAKTLLQPWLGLRRSLSHPALRRRLVRNFLDPAWYSRQWHMVRQSCHQPYF